MAVIRILQLATGAKHPFAGQFLKDYDPDRDGLRGHIEVTRSRDQALELPASELIALWRRPSTTLPLRPDGEPNRPLTAFSIEVLP